MMEMIPDQVQGAAGEWIEQQHDLAGAAALLADADTTGFAGATAAATGFVRAWRQLVEQLARTAGEQAAALRTTAADWLATDQGAADTLLEAGHRLEGR